MWAPPSRGERGNSLLGKFLDYVIDDPLALPPTRDLSSLLHPPLPSPFSPRVSALHPNVPRCCPPSVEASLAVLRFSLAAVLLFPKCPP